MTFRLALAQCCHPADRDVLGMVDVWAARAKVAGVDLLVFPESLMMPFDSSAEEFSKQAEPLDGPFCTRVDRIAAKHGLWMVYTANELAVNADGVEDAERCERAEKVEKAEGVERAERADGDDVVPGIAASVAGAAGSSTAALEPESFRAIASLRPFNTAVVVDGEGVKRAVYRKVHLFDTDFVKESDKVSAGDALMRPVETPFGRIGIGICYDLRFPELARAAALAGADIMLYPSAWVDGPRKVDQWRALLKARAIENEFFVAGLSRCDRVFGGAERDYAGNSCVFGPLGELIAEAHGIDEELLVADIDLDAIASARLAMPVLDHRRPEAY